MKPYDQMTPEELVAEASKLRSAIATSAENLLTLNQLLYDKVRRSGVGELTSPFIHIASAGKRFSGLVLQAVKRTDGVDRVLIKAKQEAEEAAQEQARQEEAKKRKAERRQATEQAERAWRERLFGTSSVTTQEDLIDLYGND